jgi:hypothetical protein
MASVYCATGRQPAKRVPGKPSAAGLSISWPLLKKNAAGQSIGLRLPLFCNSIDDGHQLQNTD